MIPSELQPLANHLWQSTLFAAVAGLLAIALRRNQAQTRYRLWLAASVKFLIPFSILVATGSHFGRHTAPAIVQSGLSSVIEQVSEPFATPAPLLTTPAAAQLSARWIPAILCVAWAIGFVTLVSSWCRQWRALRAALRTASSLDLPIDMEVMTSPAFAEPGVFGVRRPVLLLPAGITGHLTPTQLQAILAHELCHVRRRDNLATAIHMAVEALFWFHPLVWWLGARLMEERERACDEEVLLRGSQPQAYAEGILKICELYLESPLPCVSGATGANLKKRIQAIMSNRIALRLNFAKKAALVTAGMAALGVPVIVGAMNAPAVRAQAQSSAQSVSPALSFEAASVKALKSREGSFHFTVLPNRLDIKNMSLQYLIKQAYDLRDDQVSGPDWIANHGYDLAATTGAPVSPATMRTMLQNLLAERFHLATHWEMRTEAMYRLEVLPGGPKMKTAEQGYAIPNSPMQNGDSMQLDGPMSMRQLAERLTRFAGRPVVDETNLNGYFTVALGFASDDGAAPADSVVAPPPLTTAIQKQLGLKLMPGKEPIRILVVDHAEAVPVAN